VDTPYDGSGNNGAWIVDATNVTAIEGKFLSAYGFGPPAILTQPSSIVAAAGTTTNLAVVASTNSDSGVINYQWQQNNGATGGNTNKLFFAPLVFANYSTNWNVVISDGANNLTSTTVSVQPPATPPTIVTPPVGKAVPQGLPATNTVTATSVTGQTNFQWRINGVNLVNDGNNAATTTRTMTIGSMQSSNAGAYVVVVDDGFGRSLTSSPPANLTIAVNPVMTNSLSGTTYNMTAPTEVGPNYVVEFKNLLTDPSWTPLKTNAGNGSPFVVPVGATNAQRFFRTRMQ
jgi:hypothetical protein